MSKQDKNSLYEQQEEKIRAQSDAFIGILTKRGILGDQDVDDEKIRAAQQEKKKAAYHNTLVLLQQYRNIAWMLECFPSTVAEELDQPFEDLDTPLGENASTMSGGEKQRVVIARALVRHTPVLLLDESTSHLDPTTAADIERLVLGLEDVTVLLVSHNATETAKKHSDEIMEMCNGVLRKVTI